MDVATLARGLRAFADAIEGEGPLAELSQEDKKAIDNDRINRADDAAREAMQKARDEAKPQEPKELELEDLQELGAALIRSGKRDALKAILAKHDLKNLSSVKPDDFQAVWGSLTGAAE